MCYISAKHALFGLILCIQIEQTKVLQKITIRLQLMHNFVFKNGEGKYVSILVPANRPGHKIIEIGGDRYKSRFFSKTRWSTYILTFIFSTVQDCSLKRYMICFSEFVVKRAVTKYAIKNYISKSIVVSGLICNTDKNRVYFDVIPCFSAYKRWRDVILVPNCYKNPTQDVFSTKTYLE